MKEITANQFSALCLLTRGNHPGARLVLVDGLSTVDAAAKCGLRYPAVQQAVARYRRALLIAHEAVGECQA